MTNFDFKKEYKEFYLPPRKPSIVKVPKANYIAVRGEGNPNVEGGAYKQSISILYALAFTLKMSYKTDYKIKDYQPYVVPPLEGFWWQKGAETFDYSDKDNFQWISVIRLPNFISKEDFLWAIDTASKKKGVDYSMAEFLTIEEGICVQCMHIGPYDSEEQTIEKMKDYMQAQGYATDITNTRHHHEIYLSDPRRCAPEKLRTVVRFP
ncbi:MAG: GyrI-like domain-containing protein, partial [Bacteroidota bacterium]|nr:GyrI-like domain-containing protein [Bacteroidota bacterium]